MNHIEWIPVEERFPEKSGTYLVFLKYEDQVFLKGMGYSYLVDYSAKHKAFNAFDGMDEKNAAELAFRRVTHWAELPEPPEGWTLYESL